MPFPLPRLPQFFRCWPHRALAALLALVQVLALVAFAAPRPVFASSGAPCVPYPGKDGPAGTLSGVSDVYYVPPAGTLAAGSTSVTLGTIDTTGGGQAAPAIGVGDELLIIQMQDGTFTTTNSAAYGTGAALSSAGLYEYVYVSALAGSVATIVGAGAGNGLLNTYHEAAATAGHGQQTYQIIRVPQYTTGTLSNNFHAAYWDGQTGGVAVLDLDSLLTLGSASVYATGNGFRGGGYTVSGTTPAAVLNNDYADSAGMNGTNPPGMGSKAEGIFGTPANLFYYGTFTSPSTPAGAAVIAGTTDGYPGGDMAMGAPGNAGGGGTDDDPASNDQNTGGGGGSNGGAGGNGGYPWTPNYSNGSSTTGGTYSQVGVHTATAYATGNGHDIGGRGAGAIAGAPTVARAFMGGGGGAGNNNNNSNDSTNPYGKFGSSGGVGGGIVMLRLSSTSGSATFYANGTTGLAPDNDGGGGGGAGGTVVLTAPPATTFGGVTVNVNGAAGTTAARTSTTYGVQHGPGGGGGGGVVMTSSAVTTGATGGAAGTTTTFATNYGATAGATGATAAVTAASIPGVASGGECSGAAGLLYIGPVTQGAATGYSTTGQFDGSSPATNNNDFTAKAFFPTGATMANSSTTVGAWVGNVFTAGAATTIDVPSEFYDNNNPGAAKTVSLAATAPAAGWTARVCRDNGLAGAADGPSCVTGGGFTVGAAGQQSTSTIAVGANTVSGPTKFWVQYVIASGTSLTSYTRYDAPVVASDPAGNRNETHHELYPGFVVMTKNYSLPANGGCPVGQTPPANGACPGALVTYTIDYRNIVVGAASESSFINAWPWTGAGTFVITENGAAGSNNWGSSGFSCGLNEALVASANGTTTFGDSRAGSAFTTATLHSTSFTDTPGGGAFGLVPSGIVSTTGLTGVTSVGSQGTLTFRVRVTPSGICP
jgi:hypothetical protein